MKLKKMEPQVELEEARRCMLNLYHSYILSHAGYMIAIIIGTLTLVSRWDSFFPPRSNEIFPLTAIAFWGLIGALIAVGIYSFKRLLYWACYATSVLSIPMETIEEKYPQYLKDNSKDEKDRELMEKCPYTFKLEATATRLLREKAKDKKSAWNFKFAMMSNRRVLPYLVSLVFLFIIVPLLYYLFSSGVIIVY